MYSSPHTGRPQTVALRRFVHDSQSGSDTPENRVGAIQMGLHRVRYEELASTGIGSAQGHSDGPSSVPVTIQFVPNSKPWPSAPIPAGIPILNDEIVNDAVPAASIKVPLLRQLEERMCRDRGVSRVEIDLDSSAFRFQLPTR